MKRIVIAGSAIAALLFWVDAARANPIAFACDGPTPPPGTAGIYFTAQGNLACPRVSPGEPFDMYVIAHHDALGGGMVEYEFSVSVDPQVTILSRAIHPVTAVDTGAGEDNYIISTGGICIDQIGATIMVTMTAMLMVEAEDVLACLEPSTPSRIGAYPGYMTCLPGSEFRRLRPAIYGMEFYPDNCAVINSTHEDDFWGIVPIPTVSWSSLKTSFHN